LLLVVAQHAAHYTETFARKDILFRQRIFAPRVIRDDRTQSTTGFGADASSAAPMNSVDAVSRSFASIARPLAYDIVPLTFLGPNFGSHRHFHTRQNEQRWRRLDKISERAQD